MSIALEHSDIVLVNTHDPIICEGGPCTIHNRSNHVMREFRQHWRQDAGFMERICSHGIGHPDPDELDPSRAHGCDGCCFTPDEKKVSE